MPTLSDVDVLSPFTVGNGEFAFTADVTGLQTLAPVYETGIPLVTQSTWGWHTIPDSHDYRIEQTWEYLDTYGRSVPYAAAMNSAPAQYLRANPHRLHLGRIAFKSFGADIHASDVSDIRQVMDHWQGMIKSSFQFKGMAVKVQTCAHPQDDQIAVRVESPALQQASLDIGFDFPYGSLEWRKTAYDWESSHRHSSTICRRGENDVSIERRLDSTVYYVTIRWQGDAEFIEVKAHSYVLRIKSAKTFEFVCHFSRKDRGTDNSALTFEKSATYWRDFWQSGGAVDLSASADPRAAELERRIVLSQYLTAIQCSGSLPPQETGLTGNSWHGKFHLEMHWWHAAHFVLWGRAAMLEKSLPWYESILPMARAKADAQGYDGVRWPKMTGPEGLSSPSSVGEFLIWQQPHPIYFAELLYRDDPDPKVLRRYENIVFQTAAFMASFAHWDESANRYVLGPPLIPAQEIYRATETMNPPFELSYWAFGLKTAQQWRQRLGLARVEKWDHIIDHLAQWPVNDGFYQNAETALHTFTDEFHRNDHPTLLGAYGMLPNDDVDIEIMRRTLDGVVRSWNWQRTWGWDYPMVAMAAARLGRPDIAIDVLLMDVQKNTFLNNGHNYQSDRLPLYLPGNGGLLTAIAMMAAGWDGAPEIYAPGFPQDGSWTVQYEGLRKLP
ncbi:glycoside hydrolase family 65 [candidate division KSB1 bacterium]|nr:glycoside hydrolase family 65 [candidate division KSB1 bacterium]RQW01767.1 MAG: glycoside hydrolase family 65 [candidate division KSB1 bacterium]